MKPKHIDMELPVADESRICERCGRSLHAFALEGRSDVYLECARGHSQGMYTREEYEAELLYGAPSPEPVNEEAMKLFRKIGVVDTKEKPHES